MSRSNHTCKALLSGEEVQRRDYESLFIRTPSISHTAHTLINFDLQQKIRKEYCKILTVHMSYETNKANTINQIRNRNWT